MSPEDSSPTTVTADDQRLRVAALTRLQAYVKAELDAERADLHTAMRNGEGHTVWSPLRESDQIATVNRSKPKAKARVSDRLALETWLRERFPEKCETAQRVTAEGLEFLADAAPDLIETSVTVPEWAIAEVLTASAKAKKPTMPDGTTDVPGVEVDAAPEGTLSVKLSDDAAALVDELIEAELIDHRGRRREIGPA